MNRYQPKGVARDSAGKGRDKVARQTWEGEGGNTAVPPAGEAAYVPHRELKALTKQTSGTLKKGSAGVQKTIANIGKINDF